MNLATNWKHYLICILCIGLLVIAGNINNSYQKPGIVLNKQSSAININQDFLLLFSMGQKRVLSDLLWIVTLLESDHDHYKNRDLNSWMYLRFKAITTLDPQFKRAYSFGGKYLSIVKDDLEGASYILSKGLEYFPDDYSLNYDAAFLNTFELGNYDLGLKYYKKIVDYPEAPEFVKSLINKIGFEVHEDLDLAFKLVEKLYKETNEQSPLKAKLKSDLYAIKAEKDLKCLNSKTTNTNCEIRDFNGNPYLFKDNIYFSQIPFKPYRFKAKKRN